MASETRNAPASNAAAADAAAAPNAPAGTVAANAPANPTGNGNGKRRRAMLILALIILVAAASYGIYWAKVARFHESTDDAYVSGNLVQITPQVAGTVVSIAADDTDLVKQGDTLVVLDTADAQVALDRALAELAQTVRKVRNLFVNTEQFEATVTLRQVELERAQTDLERRSGLDEPGAVSAEDIQHARAAVSAAKAALTVAKEQLNSTRSLVEDTSIAQHPDVLAAAGRVREAYLALQRSTIPSAVTGYVAKRSVQVGQRVSPGAALMAIVPLNEVWVDANFKEVQLQHLRIGQPVTLTADSYGDKIEFRGSVAGMSAGTGGAFALLPAQNATGNWIKVVQRLPVRVVIDPEDLAKHPLRVGLSMTATVDIHNQGGAVLADAPRSKPAYSTPVFTQDSRAAEELIAKVIRDNAGKKNVGTLSTVSVPMKRSSWTRRREP
jgi:membrane fusion protein, multidrug efflux system